MMSNFPVKSIGVIGGGVVGRATARCYLEWCDVKVFDLVPERRTAYVEDVMNCELIFVCLPEDQVDNFARAYADSRVGWHDRNFVLRSTVPVGTTRKLRERFGLANLVHSPEFLTERCSITDAQLPARNVIGVPRGFGESVWPVTMVEKPCAKTLSQVYLARFPGIQTICCSSDESELIKLATNAFGATKIAFFNEVRSLSDRLGLDWERVHAGILSDGRIGAAWSQVPGPDGKRGFGGRCLPKDLQTLIRDFDDNGLTPNVVRAAHVRNFSIDRKRLA